VIPKQHVFVFPKVKTGLTCPGRSQQLRTQEDEPDAHREALKKELAHVETELARLATAIASGGEL